MEGVFMKSSAEFALKLDGDNQIDAFLLSKTIRDISTLTKIAANQEDSEAYLKMNVTTFKNGSFLIGFSSICEMIPESAQTLILAAPQIMDLATKSINIVKGYFEVKKHLKGDFPQKISDKKDGTVEITNDSGKVLQVLKSSAEIINNVQIDSLVVNLANSATEHNPNGGFSIIDNQGDTYYSSDDVKKIAKSFSFSETILCSKKRTQAILVIRKPDLSGNTRWGFKFDGKNIDASIEDSDFLDLIHSGTPIRTNDCIKATLEYSVDLDQNKEPIKNTEKYAVIVVHGEIVHESEQLKL